MRETYILAELVDGMLKVRVLLSGPEEEVFSIMDVSLVDGEAHLLHVSCWLVWLCVCSGCYVGVCM